MSAIVFYDPETGAIFQTGQMSLAAAEAVGRPYIVIEQYRTGLDSQFRVENGALVPLEPASPTA